jgi:hypothetical protein
MHRDMENICRAQEECEWAACRSNVNMPGPRRRRREVELQRATASEVDLERMVPSGGLLSGAVHQVHVSLLASQRGASSCATSVAVRPHLNVQVCGVAAVGLDQEAPAPPKRTEGDEAAHVGVRGEVDLEIVPARSLGGEPVSSETGLNTISVDGCGSVRLDSRVRQGVLGCGLRAQIAGTRPARQGRLTSATNAATVCRMRAARLFGLVVLVAAAAAAGYGVGAARQAYAAVGPVVVVPDGAMVRLNGCNLEVGFTCERGAHREAAVECICDVPEGLPSDQWDARRRSLGFSLSPGDCVQLGDEGSPKVVYCVEDIEPGHHTTLVPTHTIAAGDNPMWRTPPENDVSG